MPKHAATTKPTNEQARVLCNKLLGRMVVLLLAWTALFACLCAVFELTISDELGNRIADATSEWIYAPSTLEELGLDEAELDVIVEETEKAATMNGDASSDVYAEFERRVPEIAAEQYDTLASKVGSQNVQSMLSEDGRIAVRTSRSTTCSDR